MDKNTAFSKITVTHDRRRAAGPADTFDYFVDAPAGWKFVPAADRKTVRGHLHHVAVEDERQVSYFFEDIATGRVELEPCDCGCAKEAR